METKTKIIYDIIHGYIPIDEDVEKIINSQSFQRLKHVSQLSAQHLYPSANHTRFEHSLGVMKLSIDAYNQIKNDLKKRLQEYEYKCEGCKFEKCEESVCESKRYKEHLESNEGKIKKYLDFLYFHLKYAALLHDIGHAPLSHVGEELYNKDEIIEKIKEPFTKYNCVSIAKHELMSCFVIQENFIKILAGFLEGKDYELDINFIFRIITGFTYNLKWDRNLLIALVNGKTFDVDKMDYLMRDNLMTGNVGGYIDKERILGALTIPNRKTIAFRMSAISSLKKLIDCRDSLYMWVYNHHVVAYTDYLYIKFLKHLISLKKEPLNQEDDVKSIKEFDDIKEYFDCNAIATNNMTDNAVYFLLEKVINLVQQGKIKNPITKALANQLSGRQFLSACWKTLFEYNNFMEKFSSVIKRNIPKYIQKDENREKLEEYLANSLHITRGEIFIVPRVNKFYNNNIQDIPIFKDFKNGGATEFELRKFLPERNYEPLYGKVAFYFFTHKDKREKAMEFFEKYIKEHDIEID